jgi:hypothetical protein
MELFQSVLEHLNFPDNAYVLIEDGTLVLAEFELEPSGRFCLAYNQQEIANLFRDMYFPAAIVVKYDFHVLRQVAKQHKECMGITCMESVHGKPQVHYVK